MAKIPSEHLFRLIKSLSGSEKRYFKLYAGAENPKDALYLTLFDLIDHSSAFEDQVYQRKLYGRNQVDGKKYPVLKAYLYDAVLKSLQSFDEQNSVIYKLNGLLQGVAVLYKRGLYSGCEPLLAKAEKLAAHYESYSYLIEVMDWRKQLAYTRADIDFLDKELQRIHAREQEVLALQSEILTAKQDFFNMLLRVRREAQVSKSVGAELHIGEVSYGSIKAEIFRLRTLNLYHYASQNPEAFWQSGADLLHFIEQFPHFFKENLTEYIAALSNFIVACGLLSRYDLVETTLQKLRNLAPNTLDDKRKIHRQYYSNHFAFCVFSGDFERGKALIETHKQEIEALQIARYESDTTLVQYFLIYFGCQEYDRALDCLNEWMNQPRTVGRQDIQSLVRVLNLIIHYEQGNSFLLEYKLRGTERYLRSKKQTYVLEKLFIRLITDLIKTENAQERRKRFEQAAQELKTIEQQPEVRTLLKTFDFTSWVAAKMTGKSFADLVQEHYRKQVAEKT
jgi:hypothetical protein